MRGVLVLAEFIVGNVFNCKFCHAQYVCHETRHGIAKSGTLTRPLADLLLAPLQLSNTTPITQYGTVSVLLHTCLLNSNTRVIFHLQILEKPRRTRTRINPKTNNHKRRNGNHLFRLASVRRKDVVPLLHRNFLLSFQRRVVVSSF